MEEAAGDVAKNSARVTIQVRKNGPYYIEGPIQLVDADGNPFEVDDKVWLCRCGGSANKPFCDGTHKRIGFQSEVHPDRSGG